MNEAKLKRDESPWPHRSAWLLCCATFPLIWIGGLITTTDAGMAVPDWPGTYGYNLFLYPWQTWLFGPWDLLVEHGHRLFASGVGLLTIGLVVVVWRNTNRALVRWLSVVALLLVIWQGVLGGLRVLLNERLLAMLHGSTGPLFFALTAALVALTSPSRRSAEPQAVGSGSWVWVLPIVVYFQLVAGAALRHAPEASSFNTFAVHVQVHLWGALIVSLMVLLTAGVAWRYRDSHSRRRLAVLIVGVLLLQLSLGVATWVAKYRLPGWAQSGPVATAWETTIGEGTISPSVAGGWGQTHIVTGHSANGSLLLALATAHAVIASRRLAGPSPLLETDTPNSTPQRSDSPHLAATS